MGLEKRRKDRRMSERERRVKARGNVCNGTNEARLARLVPKIAISRLLDLVSLEGWFRDFLRGKIEQTVSKDGVRRVGKDEGSLCGGEGSMGGELFDCFSGRWFRQE